MSGAVGAVVLWLLATCAAWVALQLAVAWVLAAPACENWTDERTWGMRCEHYGH